MHRFELGAWDKQTDGRTDGLQQGKDGRMPSGMVVISRPV